MKYLDRNNVSRTAGAALVALAAVFVFPIAAFAVSSNASTTVSSAIAQTISVTSSGTVNVNVTPTAAGAQSYASDNVQVSTNDTAGYTLTLVETTAANTSLAAGANNIPATANTTAAPAVQAVNTWGFCVSNSVVTNMTCPASAQSSTAISGTYQVAKIPPSTPFTINSNAATATNAATTVWYGVAANTSTPAATYTNSVTYTATGN